jgi:hypothetical protein
MRGNACGAGMTCELRRSGVRNVGRRWRRGSWSIFLGGRMRANNLRRNVYARGLAMTQRRTDSDFESRDDVGWLDYESNKSLPKKVEAPAPSATKIPDRLDRTPASGILAFLALVLWIPWIMMCVGAVIHGPESSDGQSTSIGFWLALSLPLVVALTAGCCSLLVAKRGQRNALGKIALFVAVTVVILIAFAAIGKK